MPLSTYEKPDVEVQQVFTNQEVSLQKATLQAVIIGPAYKNITNEQIGSYSGVATALPYPTLPAGSIKEFDSLKVTIENFAGIHEIAKSTIRVDGNNGKFVIPADPAITPYFEAPGTNFLEVGTVAGQGSSPTDGDYVYITETNSYHEVIAINNSGNKLTLDPAPQVELTDVSYTVASFGYIATANRIRLAPNLSTNGVVKLSMRARRTDYSKQLIACGNDDDLKAIFGVDEIGIENPLAYGMSLGLTALDADEAIYGLMVTEDTPEAYQAALDILESVEVYCLVPLSQNPIVHQMFDAHVKKMSAMSQKKERICLINTDRIERITKSGYFGNKDKTTGIYSKSIGEISMDITGSLLNDVTSVLPYTFTHSDIGNAQIWGDANDPIPAGYDRFIVYEEDTLGAAIEYSLTSDPNTYLPVTLTTDNSAVVQIDGDTIASIRYTSPVEDSSVCNVYILKTINMPTSKELFYPMVAENSEYTHNSNTYDPVGGWSGLKIRAYDINDRNKDMLSGALPGGMVIKVTYGTGQTREITNAGTYNFDGDLIELLQVKNDLDVFNEEDYVVEVMMVPSLGTSENKLTDDTATFLSDRVEAGDELVIEDGPNKGVYLIKEVASETEILIQDNFVEEQPVTMLDTTGDGIPDTKVGGAHYQVRTQVIEDKNALAEWYRDYSMSFGNRRTTHIFAPYVGVYNDNEEIVAVPGYYLACAYAGMTQSERPEQGFTNMSIPGFAKVFYTNSYFTDTQMNIIAEGGTTIIVQHAPNAPLSARHQLTTDMLTVETREYSVTKNVDYMAKSARITFRPYLGRFNINKKTLTTLYSVGNALTNKWKKDENLISGSPERFYQNPEQKDAVIACFYMKVPLPLNHIRLIFVI